MPFADPRLRESRLDTRRNDRSCKWQTPAKPDGKRVDGDIKDDTESGRRLNGENNAAIEAGWQSQGRGL